MGLGARADHERGRRREGRRISYMIEVWVTEERLILLNQTERGERIDLHITASMDSGDIPPATSVSATSGPKSTASLPDPTSSRYCFAIVDTSLRIPRSKTTVRPSGCSMRKDLPGTTRLDDSSDVEPGAGARKCMEGTETDRKELKILTEATEAEAGSAMGFKPTTMMGFFNNGGGGRESGDV